MEFLGMIGLVIAWLVFRYALNAGAKTARAAGRAVMGKGTFSENLEVAFRGMEALSVRIVDDRLGEDGTGPHVKALEMKGLFPIARPVQAGISVSVVDVTDEEPAPVLSYLDQFQEADSLVFQSKTTLGMVKPNHGFIGWVRIGGIFPEMLQPPMGGPRQLLTVVRLIDAENPVPIELGWADPNHHGNLWTGTVSFSFSYDGKGYREASADRDEAGALIVKLGVAVAMSDGSLAEAEGNVLKRWVQRSVSPFSQSKQEELKRRYNEAMKSSYSDAQRGDLSLSALTGRLAEIDDRPSKYEAMELCFDILAADGKADSSELRTIRAIAEALDLDFAEIEAMRDKRILELDAASSVGLDVSELLGIQDEWSDEQVKAHLRNEFQKWNNRLTALPAGAERDNAQKMINLIADARRQYE